MSSWYIKFYLNSKYHNKLQQFSYFLRNQRFVFRKTPSRWSMGWASDNFSFNLYTFSKLADFFAKNTRNTKFLNTTNNKEWITQVIVEIVLRGYPRIKERMYSLSRTITSAFRFYRAHEGNFRRVVGFFLRGLANFKVFIIQLMK